MVAYRRVYEDTVKRYAKQMKLVGVSLVFAMFIMLSARGDILLTGYSGDSQCAGTLEEPCYAYLNFTAELDIYIYPTNDTTWAFMTEPKNAMREIVMQRSWGDSWRTINLSKTWSTKTKYALKLNKGQDYEFRFIGYKYNPTDTVKWGFGFQQENETLSDSYVDPVWSGYSYKDFFTKLIENHIDGDKGIAVFEVTNPTSVPLVIPVQAWSKQFEKVNGDVKSSKIELVTDSDEIVIKEVPNHVCSDEINTICSIDNHTMIETCVDFLEEICNIQGTKLIEVIEPKGTIKPLRQIKLESNETVILKLTGDLVWSPQINIDWFVFVNVLGFNFKSGEWAWWNQSFPLQREIEINTSEDVTNYQINMILTNNTNYQNDWDDMRFTGIYANCTEDTSQLRPYWIEDKTDGTNVSVWINSSFYTACNNGTQLYNYYNNSAANNLSNINNTMLFGDDAGHGLSIAGYGWTVIDGSWAYIYDNERNSTVISGHGGTTRYNAITNGYSGQDYIFHAEAKPTLESTLQFVLNFRNNGASDFFFFDNGNDGRLFYKDASYHQIGGDGFGGNCTGWHSYDIKVKGASTDVNILIYKNTVLIKNETYTGTSNNASIIGMGSYNNQNSSFDNIYQRKYIETEPTYSIGAEESANTPPEIIANVTSPAVVYSNTDWLVNMTIIDADAGDTITGYVQFCVNDSVCGSVYSQTVTNNTNTLIATLVSGNYSANDNLTATVWAGDGTVNLSKTNMTATVSIISEIILNTPLDASWSSSKTIDFNFTPTYSTGFTNCSVWSNFSEKSIYVTELADSYVSSGNADTNYGTSIELIIQQGTTVDKHAYLLWNLSSLPTDSIIISSVMSVYAASGNPGIVEAYNTSNSWTETGITWNNKPSEAILQDSVYFTAGWEAYDVTEATKYQFSQSNKNLSIIIRYSDSVSATNFINFRSKETIYANPPKLLITYLVSDTPFTQMQVNTTPIINNEINTISAIYTIDGTYLWGIQCYDDDDPSISTFSTTNRTINIDTIAPTYSENSINSTAVDEWVQYSLKWNDKSLSGYIFSFDNGTGTFVNDSWVSMTGTINWSNVSKYVNATIGNTIRWKVYANDSANNWKKSIIYSYVPTILCGTLSLSNKIYTLTTNISSTDTCFTISANNITIDGDGYTINFSTVSTGYAINGSDGYDNITIKNINIEQYLVTDYSYGIKLVGTDNVLINNVSINVKGALSQGIYLVGSATNSNISDSNITSSATGSGSFGAINLYYDQSNNYLINNIIKKTGSGDGSALKISDLDNTTVYNNEISSVNGRGIFISSSFTNISGGNILGGLEDYSLWNIGSTNNFTNTNFTEQKTIYFNDVNSWFNYNNESAGYIWLKTKISVASKNINRTLINWNTTQMQWNDTASADLIATYTLNGLISNTNYNFKNGSTEQIIQTDANGALSVNIALDSGTLTNLKIVEILAFEISINSPDNETVTTDSTPDVNFTVIGGYDNYDCELFINTVGYGINVSTVNNTATIITANDTLTDGIYDWNINCTANSLTNSSEIRSITIDTTKPVITFISPTQENYTSITENYTYINWSVVESNQDTMIFNWNGTNTTVTNTYYNKTDLADGRYTYYVWINDTAGNHNQTEIRTIIIGTPDMSIITNIETFRFDPAYLTEQNVQPIGQSSTISAITVSNNGSSELKLNITMCLSELTTGWDFEASTTYDFTTQINLTTNCNKTICTDLNSSVDCNVWVRVDLDNPTTTASGDFTFNLNASEVI